MRTRNLLTAIAAALLILTSCGKASGPADKRFDIYFPSRPVVLFDNVQAGVQVINYFNIVQTDENMYRMYYIAVDNEVKIEEFAHKLHIAWSDDLLNWHLENPLGGSDVIMEGILEQSVCYTPGDEMPYRLTGNIWEEGRYKLCTWLSRDGVEFTDRKVILEDRMHDSQCVVIPEKDHLKLYYRQSVRLGPGNYDRRVVMRRLDKDANPVTDMAFITGHYEYNSAASRIEDGYDLLIPTYFNNAPGNGDSCFFKAYIQHGFYSQEIECPLNDWIEPDEKWFLAAPGILRHDGKSYIAYGCRNTSHDQGCVDRSYYKLIEIEISEHDDDAALCPHINRSGNGVESGDLLFIGTPAGTGEGFDYIHAAILEVDGDGRVWTIDATPEHGVRRQPLDTFLEDFTHGEGITLHCEVMRLPDNRRAESYVARAKSLSGTLYCTELIQDSYRDFGMFLFKYKPAPGYTPGDMHADERLQLVTTLDRE